VAAATPLTIPVQVTLSDFKLSGFVILVFSTVKGVTLVFRNDPLESVKVQSTFDSIPFIKEYLQQEIERQVRELFQEELPLAVYRLSLGLLEGEIRPPKERQDEDNSSNGTEIDEECFTDPLFISLESTDIPPFPEANMLRLRALMNSQRTLSLFTPAIHSAIYRAMPLSTDLDRVNLTDTPPTPTSRASRDIKPATPLYSNSSSHAHLKRRKRKRRIVNLRKDADSVVPSEASSDYSDSVTTSSAPECRHGGVGLPPPGARPTSVAGDRERSHLRRQFTPPQTGPVSLHRGQHPPLEPIVTDIPRVSTYTSPVSIAERPPTEMGGKYTGSIVERAFMMRFMTEMQRQAVEQQRRGSGGLERPPSCRTQ
jgi:distribution and morphology protein 34